MPTKKPNWKVPTVVTIAIALAGGGGTTFGAWASDEKVKRMIEDNPVIVTLKNDMAHLTKDFSEFKTDYKDDQDRASSERDAILKAVEAR